MDKLGLVIVSVIWLLKFLMIRNPENIDFGLMKTGRNGAV